MPDTLLIVEDDPVQRKIVATLLQKKLGYDVVMASDGKEAMARVQASQVGEISAVLLDIHMPEMDGFETLKAIRKYRPDLPVLMLTGSDDASVAVRAIKEGASDFIVKPPEPEHLGIAIKNAIRISVLSRELAKMKRDKEGALSFDDLVGSGGGLAEAVTYGRKAASSTVPVLITGESGVGKELFARAIHGESKRVGGPFVATHGGVGVDALMDAIRKADGGTVFLDDVGRLLPEAQVRLLRLLQHKDIELTSAGKSARVNVRLIAASEADLLREVESGRFREDLYFRLNILPIHLPPLRARVQDIVPLAEYFIERLSAAEGLPSKALSKEAKEYLARQRFSGNVRELENMIHRALVLSEDDVVDAGALQATQVASASSADAPITERRAFPPLHINLRALDGGFKTMLTVEAEAMHLMLSHFDGNITRAADALGIAKSTFYRKLKEQP